MTEQPAAVPDATQPAPQEAPQQEPVPVAEQRAAGVPPEETVTLAEQKAGAEPPAAVQEAPSVLTTQLRAGGGTSNESPPLPPTLPSGAARAQSLLARALDEGNGADGGWEHRVLALVQRAHDELDRYVPHDIREAAGVEAGKIISAEL